MLSIDEKLSEFTSRVFDDKLFDCTTVQENHRVQKKTSVKLELDTAVHTPQFYNSITVTQNCTLCSKSLVILGKISALHKSQFLAQLYCTDVLHKLRFQDVVALL